MKSVNSKIIGRQTMGGVAIFAWLITAAASEAFELIADQHFQNGIEVLAPTDGSSDGFLNTNASATTYWQLAQWNCQQTIYGVTPTTLPSGSEEWADAYKAITMGPLASSDADLILALDGDAEFGGVYRSSGSDPWPNLLVQQDIAEPSYGWYPGAQSIGQLSDLPLHIELKLLKAIDNIGSGYDPGIHGAEFLLYFTIQNLNLTSPDYGDFLWFGLRFYDSRDDEPGLTSRPDIGTGKWIYNVGVAPFDWSAGGLTTNGSWRILDTDLLPYIKDGLQAAWTNGYLPNSIGQYDDYKIGSMNMGWEITGLNDCAMQVKNFSVTEPDAAPAPGIMQADGYADRVIVRDLGDGTANWMVDATTTNGFGDGVADLEGTFGLITDTPLLGDVNGDGHVDRVIARQNISGGFWEYFADYSTANGFGDGVPDTAFSFGGLTLIPTAIVDLNGDGYADRLGVVPGGGALEWVGDYSTASGFGDGVEDYHELHGAPTHTPIGAYDLESNGNVNRVVDTGGGYWVASSNNWQGTFGGGGIPYFMGDMNNDGYGDRVGIIGDTWYGDLSTSSNFGDGDPNPEGLISTSFIQPGDIPLLSDVISEAPSPYAFWASTHGLTPGVNDDPSDNPDAAGGSLLNNLYEFGLGGDPLDASDEGTAPIIFVVEQGGTNWFVHVHPERSNPDAGLHYYLELTDNLVLGSWTNSGYSFFGTGTLDAEFDWVTNVVSTIDDDSQFVRLIIEEQ